MSKPILFAALMLFGQSGLAMQCVPESVEKYYRKADFVFEATVEERAKIAGEGG